jgi:hypothetical protein
VFNISVNSVFLLRLQSRQSGFAAGLRASIRSGRTVSLHSVKCVPTVAEVVPLIGKTQVGKSKGNAILEARSLVHLISSEAHPTS